MGLFHDILEDKHVTYTELFLFLSSYDRYHAYIEVVAITRKEEEKYFDYIRRLKECDGVAKKVKLADLYHNLSRKATLKPSLEKRYKKALRILDEC